NASSRKLSIDTPTLVPTVVPASGCRKPSRMTSSLCDDRIAGVAPQGVRVIEHQGNHQRHKLAQQIGAVTQLLAIDGAVPGGAAVHQLITQGIQTIEDESEQYGRIAAAQGVICFLLAPFEALFPV